MKTIQLTAHGAPGVWEFVQRPDPAPAAGEVCVKVHACGLNRLDLWFEEGLLPMTLPLPRVPGGEIAGEVESCGEGVTDWKQGGRVAVQSNLFCGHCEFCRKGDESLCLTGQLLGLQRDGGLAEKVCVPASALVRLPEAVPFVTAAALTLAGSTAMHMLTRRLTVRPGDWVLAMGGNSGVGSAAIQIARHLGAQVISTGSTPAKCDLAVSLGAHYVVDSTLADWPEEVRRITGKRGVDVVVEHIGGNVLQQCFTCLARGGAIVTCGATSGREVTLPLWPLFVKEQRLIGSYGRTRQDIIATLDWAARGVLKPVIDSIYPLHRVGEAVARLRAREVMGKLVIQPGD